MWLNYCCSMCWFSSSNSSCIIRNEGTIIVLWYILYIHIISGQWPHKLDDSEPEASSPIQRSLKCFIEPRLLVFLARFVPALAMHGAACATVFVEWKIGIATAITLSFRLVIFVWRNWWTASHSLRTRPYQQYGKGSQGASEGIHWKFPIVDDYPSWINLKNGDLAVSFGGIVGRRWKKSIHTYDYIYGVYIINKFLYICQLLYICYVFIVYRLSCSFPLFDVGVSDGTASTSCDTWEVGIWRSRSSRCSGMDSRFGTHVQLV